MKNSLNRHFNDAKCLQQAMVAEIEAEQKLVAANHELIERFEKIIQATLARVFFWGGEEEKLSTV